MRRLVNGSWTLEKLTNPIDDPRQYQKQYPATDDPGAAHAPPGTPPATEQPEYKPIGERLSPEKSKLGGREESPIVISSEHTPPETPLPGPSHEEQEVDRFLEGITKDSGPMPARPSPRAPSRSDSDRTEASHDSFVFKGESAKEKYDRLVRETEAMKKQRDKELEKQMKKSHGKTPAKTPAKAPGKGAKKGEKPKSVRELFSSGDEDMGPEEPIAGTSKGKGKGKGKGKTAPKQTALTLDDPEIPKKIRDLCRTKVCSCRCT